MAQETAGEQLTQITNSVYAEYIQLGQIQEELWSVDRIDAYSRQVFYLIGQGTEILPEVFTDAINKRRIVAETDFKKGDPLDHNEYLLLLVTNSLPPEEWPKTLCAALSSSLKRDSSYFLAIDNTQLAAAKEIEADNWQTFGAIYFPEDEKPLSSTDLDKFNLGIIRLKNLSTSDAEYWPLVESLIYNAKSLVIKGYVLPIDQIASVISALVKRIDYLQAENRSVSPDEAKLSETLTNMGIEAAILEFFQVEVRRESEYLQRIEQEKQIVEIAKPIVEHRILQLLSYLSHLEETFTLQASASSPALG